MEFTPAQEAALRVWGTGVNYSVFANYRGWGGTHLLASYTWMLLDRGLDVVVTAPSWRQVKLVHQYYDQTFGQTKYKFSKVGDTEITVTAEKSWPSMPAQANFLSLHTAIMRARPKHNVAYLIDEITAVPQEILDHLIALSPKQIVGVAGLDHTNFQGVPEPKVAQCG